MISRGWAYIVKAGTIILVCNFIVQLMLTFTFSFKVIDYDGITETAFGYGGKVAKVRALACVWSYGRDGKPGTKDDIRSWAKGQEVE